MKELKFNFKYVGDERLLYCAIEKTGCTFWKRIMHVIGGWGNTSNPVDIPSEDADKFGGYTNFVGVNFTDIYDTFVEAKTVMFVRDPFTRLFSAWLDKFYSPNPYYWKFAGTYMVKRNRFHTKTKANETVDAPNCGYDVSFEEFIRYVANYPKKSCLDPHFSANFRHCMPCQFDFQYIGKYETFKEDTLFLLKELNLTDKVTFTEFEKDATYDAIHGLSEWVFLQRPDIEMCNVSFHCALFRTFKRFQGRGIIHKTIQFPYDNGTDFDNLTRSEFETKMLDLSKVVSTSEKKANRQESLLQAYKSLPVMLLDKLKESLRIDFVMYGYSDSPGYLEGDVVDFNYFETCAEAGIS